MQILVSNNNPFSTLSKSSISHHAENDLIHTHEAQSTVIFNTSESININKSIDDNSHHVQTLKMKPKKVLSDPTFDHLISSNEEQRFHFRTLLTGTLILAITSIISAVILPQITAHIILFGILALLSFNVTSKIPPILHAPTIAWCIIPASIIIVMCLPYAKANESVLIVSYVMLLLFLINLILSCGIIQNKRLLTLFQPKKKQKKNKKKRW